MENNYEQKYKKALDNARLMYDAGSNDVKHIVGQLFPELAESEDEKILVIIKHCIESRYLYTSTIQGISLKQCLAWLERQGEHANFRNKIQVGDKVTRNEDGVLVNLSQLNRVAKKNEKQGKQKFEMKTAEESLGIDSDTFNKIVDECIFGEQKSEENKGNIGGISPTWSVEDEQHIDSLLKRLDALCRNKFERTRFAISEDREWLKSLRPQNTWKPSDEQLNALHDAAVYVDKSMFPYPKGILMKLYKQLKKLREE